MSTSGCGSAGLLCGARLPEHQQQSRLECDKVLTSSWVNVQPPLETLRDMTWPRANIGAGTLQPTSPYPALQVHTRDGTATGLAPASTAPPPSPRRPAPGCPSVRHYQASVRLTATCVPAVHVCVKFCQRHSEHNVHETCTQEAPLPSLPPSLPLLPCPPAVPCCVTLARLSSRSLALMLDLLPAAAALPTRAALRNAADGAAQIPRPEHCGPGTPPGCSSGAGQASSA